MTRTYLLAATAVMTLAAAVEMLVTGIIPEVIMLKET